MINKINLLANLNRLKIMTILLQNELSIFKLEVILALSQITASRHLATLREAELIEYNEKAQWFLYKASYTLLQNSHLLQLLAENIPFTIDRIRLINYKNKYLNCSITRQYCGKVTRLIEEGNNEKK